MCIRDSCSSAVEHSLGKGEVSGSSPDEGTRGIAWYHWDLRDQHFVLNSYIYLTEIVFSNATIVIQDAQNLSCGDHELWSGF